MRWFRVMDRFMVVFFVSGCDAVLTAGDADGWCVPLLGMMGSLSRGYIMNVAKVPSGKKYGVPTVYTMDRIC